MPCSIMKTVIRFGVIGGLIAGGAALVAGPQRVAALVTQTREKVNDVIDRNIDDPIAMRAQLRDLESQYPRRIAEVRSHLADIRTQMQQVSEDRSVSQRVVELARADYTELTDLIARAEAVNEEHGGAKLVKVAFDNRTFRLPEAYSRATNIRQTIDLYSASVNDFDAEIDTLQMDSEQLEALLAKLENEHQEFQSQLAHLERQIDTVARKEKMVDILAERQQRFDELSRYKVASLDQFRSKLAKKNAELDAEMASLTRRENQTDYEDKARIQLDQESSVQSRAEMLLESSKPAQKDVVEVRPEGNEVKKSDDGRMAWGKPVIIQ